MFIRLATTVACEVIAEIKYKIKYANFNKLFVYKIFIS